MSGMRPITEKDIQDERSVGYMSVNDRARTSFAAVTEPNSRHAARLAQLAVSVQASQVQREQSSSSRKPTSSISWLPGTRLFQRFQPQIDYAPPPTSSSPTPRPPQPYSSRQPSGQSSYDLPAASYYGTSPPGGSTRAMPSNSGVPSSYLATTNYYASQNELVGMATGPQPYIPNTNPAGNPSSTLQSPSAQPDYAPAYHYQAWSSAGEAPTRAATTTATTATTAAAAAYGPPRSPTPTMIPQSPPHPSFTAARPATASHAIVYDPVYDPAPEVTRYRTEQSTAYTAVSGGRRGATQRLHVSAPVGSDEARLFDAIADAHSVDVGGGRGGLVRGEIREKVSE